MEELEIDVEVINADEEEMSYYDTITGTYLINISRLLKLILKISIA